MGENCFQIVGMQRTLLVRRIPFMGRKWLTDGPRWGVRGAAMVPRTRDHVEDNPVGLRINPC